MPPTAATIGYGGEAFLGTSTDVATLVQLAEVTEFPLPEDQVAEIEATHMLSPGRRKEFIPGLIDGGSGDVIMNYVPGSPTDVLCRAALTAGDTRAFRIKLLQADGTYWQVDVNVIVKGYKRNIPIDNRITATLTVRFTGAAVETDV